MKHSQPAKPLETKEKAAKILSDAPQDKGFYFHLGVNDYTGHHAKNLAQFCQLLETVDPRSVEFHLARKDFENWVRSLGDNALPLQLAKLRKKGLSGEQLRFETHRIVEKRLRTLEKEAAK